MLTFKRLRVSPKREQWTKQAVLKQNATVKKMRSRTKQEAKLNQQPHKFRMQLDEEIR
jgi:hypothetical protein